MLIKNATTEAVKENYVKESKSSVGTKEIEHNKPLDLCSTCNYSQSCIHHKSNGTLIIYCEEFDDFVPARRDLKMHYENIKEQASGLAVKEMKKYLGLCGNCDFRETCTHTIPESGIWHCEDYQ